MNNTQKGEAVASPFKLLLLFLGIFGDIGEVAVKFAAIESVADNEMVGNGEQRKVCLEVDKTS